MSTLLSITLGAAAAAQLGPVLQVRAGIIRPRNLLLQGQLLAPTGGTTIDGWVQTSVDGGGTWIDIANFHFTTTAARAVFNLSSLTPVTTQLTPTDGSLTANTVKDGILGDRYRVKWTSVGTYSAGVFQIDAAGLPLGA